GRAPRGALDAAGRGRSGAPLRAAAQGALRRRLRAQRPRARRVRRQRRRRALPRRRPRGARDAALSATRLADPTPRAAYAAMAAEGGRLVPTPPSTVDLVIDGI